MEFETIPCRAGREEASPCACCGASFPRRRVAIRFAEGEGPPREICPECILRGPAGAAGEIRMRIAAGDPAGVPDVDRVPDDSRTALNWVAALERRVRALESLEAFPLSIRRAAVRETRERR